MTESFITVDESIQTEPNHLPALDGLRGLAILLVMIFHFLPFDDVPTSPVGRAVFFIFSCGWCGVDLFFVLSGFLITGILLNQKGTPHFFRIFYARRTLRIFPLYYFVLALIFGLLPLMAPQAMGTPEMLTLRHRQGWLWAYAANVPITWRNDIQFFHAGWLFLSPFWSLAIEEHFYLAWPAVVYFSSRRALLWVCGVGMVMSLLLRIWLHRHGYEWGIYLFTLARVDSLMIGGAIAVVFREHRQWIARSSSIIRWLPWLMAVIWFLAIWQDPRREHMMAISVGYSLTALFFASLLLRCVALTAYRGIFAGKLLGIFGKYSYGLYVYHILLWPTFTYGLGHRQLQNMFTHRLHLPFGAYTAGVLLHMLLSGALSFGAAWLSWHLIEKQFLKLKKYFRYESASLHLA